MSNRARKFQNIVGVMGRASYSTEPMKRQKVIWSRKYRAIRRHKNEISFQSRKRNRHQR